MASLGGGPCRTHAAQISRLAQKGGRETSGVSGAPSGRFDERASCPFHGPVALQSLIR